MQAQVFEINYHSKNITIDQKGIKIKSKPELSIVFQECIKNAVDYFNNSPDFEVTDLTGEKFTCVAVRDYKEVAYLQYYIEFFSNPPVRIVFSRGLFMDYSIRNYRYFVKKINHFGFTTYDMS